MSNDNTRIGRRGFLRAMGVGGAGVAAIAASVIAPQAVTEAQATESVEEAKKARYDANSEEVKTFYRVNRY